MTPIHAKRKDNNQDELEAVFHEYGWQTIDTHDLGAGRPDFIATVPRCANHNETLIFFSLFYWIEAKSKNGKLTIEEQKFKEKADPHAQFIRVARTREDVGRIIKEVEG